MRYALLALVLVALTGCLDDSPRPPTGPKYECEPIKIGEKAKCRVVNA